MLQLLQGSAVRREVMATPGRSPENDLQKGNAMNADSTIVLSHPAPLLKETPMKTARSAVTQPSRLARSARSKESMMKTRRSILGIGTLAFVGAAVTVAAPHLARAQQSISIITVQPVTSNLAIGSQMNSGRTRVFFQSVGNTLYASDQQANGTWTTAQIPTYNATTWTTIANVAGNIAVDPHADFSGGSASLFYKGTDGRVWWATPTIFQAKWVWACRQVGTVTIASDPVVVKNNDVVYRASDNRIWATWLDGSNGWQTAPWAPWGGSSPNNVTGNLAKEPSSGSLMVYYRGTDKCLWGCRWMGAGFTNERLTTTANMASSPVVRGDSDLVYVNTSGGLSRVNKVGTTWAHSIWYTPGSTNPVISNGPNRIAMQNPSSVFFRRLDGFVYRADVPNGGSAFTDNAVGGGVYSHPTRGVFWNSVGIRKWNF